MVTVKNT